MSKFQGTWNLVDSDNMDAFLTATGVGLLKRKVILNLKSEMTFDINDNSIKITMKTKVKTTENTYESGVSKEEEDPVTGEKGTVTYTLDGDSKMCGTFVYAKDGSTVNISREITADGWTQVMEYNGVKCTRKFVKA